MDIILSDFQFQFELSLAKFSPSLLLKKSLNAEKIEEEK